MAQPTQTSRKKAQVRLLAMSLRRTQKGRVSQMKLLKNLLRKVQNPNRRLKRLPQQQKIAPQSLTTVETMVTIHSDNITH
jgi:hypothetical protein